MCMFAFTCVCVYVYMCMHIVSPSVGQCDRVLSHKFMATKHKRASVPLEQYVKQMNELTFWWILFETMSRTIDDLNYE